MCCGDFGKFYVIYFIYYSYFWNFLGVFCWFKKLVLILLYIIYYDKKKVSILVDIYGLYVNEISYIYMVYSFFLIKFFRLKEKVLMVD